VNPEGGFKGRSTYKVTARPCSDQYRLPR